MRRVTDTRQAEFVSILEHSFSERSRILERYIEQNKTQYETFARAITPDYSNPPQLWDRAALAILSDHAVFPGGHKGDTVPF